MADHWCCHRRTILSTLLVCLTLFGSLLVKWPSLMKPFLTAELNEFMVPYDSTNTNSTNTLIPDDSTNTHSSTNTTILVWHWAFGSKQDIHGNVCQDRFGIPNCFLSDDRSLFPQADFVIFHNRELINGQQLPLHLPRPEEQGWVWFSWESPAHNGNIKFLDGKMNYTMSYRRDADFFVPYGWLEPHNVGSGMTVDDFIPKNKSYLACWVVSNYAGHHKRTQVYNKLKKVIPVEVYGGAMGRRLNGEQLLPTISRCYFYLSFENSQFQDYVTEKLWSNALKGGAVPVVLGPSRKNYEAMIPKDSFIHVDDFWSVEELGAFLKKLAEDRERYASYFKWKLNYRVSAYDNWLVDPLCRICTIRSTLQKPKVYRNLYDWERK
ncbi:alpha-(1,3)-fucosyltransferase 7-like [Engraulis encrasicolus]|uniref:alpha-(1,3)-fucosyltransferase 7-like n=1 Tax=Engraulis encrasicolus TaxID=184585 RepID=UPI002FD61231